MHLLIKQVRKERSLTQQGLAALVGMSQSKVSRIETGKQSVTLETLSIFASALGVAISALYQSTDIQAHRQKKGRAL